jgi:DNA-binding transcriptional MerR regulator
MAPDRLLTIGEFSRLTRISVRMLRHYDEHGVLAPSRVDAWTGYRHYSPDLLAVAGRIRELRDVGLGVAELAACAALWDDPAALRRVLARQRERLADEAGSVALRLQHADRLLTQLEETAMSTTPIAITRTTLPARTVASVRGTIPTYADEGLLWQRLTAALDATGATVAPEAIAVAVFHDDEAVEHDADVEVQLSVGERFDDTDVVRCMQVPATDVVVGTLHGSYDQMAEVMSDLGRWILEHDLGFAGPMFNIYRVGPATGVPPEQWVTDVCVPVSGSDH